jgi:hypothetical protein
MFVVLTVEIMLIRYIFLVIESFMILVWISSNFIFLLLGKDIE